jgi:Mg-chelatase subunit ChlD
LLAWAPCLTPSPEANVGAPPVNRAVRHALFPSQILSLQRAFNGAGGLAMIPVLLLVAAANVPRIDVAFAIDTTGSMGDEIDVVKEKIVEIARNISAGQPRPDVRFGIVAYRDRGDAYVTRAFPFSREIADVQQRVRSLSADGGGDEPEAVAEGLYAAVHELQWDYGKETARMIFLIGDAGPQRYPDGKDWRKVTSGAAEKGIAINVIACSGLSAAGEQVFAKIARMTDGTMMHLTYTRVARAADGRKFSVLNEGGTTWVADRELSEAEWKKGARELAKEGKVHAAAVPPAAAVGAASTNNLDAEIARTVRAKAESLGVSY